MIISLLFVEIQKKFNSLNLKAKNRGGIDINVEPSFCIY